MLLQYTFSFALENVVTPQPSPSVFISLRDPLLDVNLIDSLLMEKDGIRPPLLIDGPKVLSLLALRVHKFKVLSLLALLVQKYKF